MHRVAQNTMAVRSKNYASKITKSFKAVKVGLLPYETDTRVERK